MMTFAKPRSLLEKRRTLNTSPPPTQPLVARRHDDDDTHTTQTFTKALLTSVPAPSLLSLLCMVTLNESLMAAAEARGVSSVLQGPLLQFKIAAFPLIQAAFEEHAQSLRRLMALYGIAPPSGRASLGSSSSASSAAGGALGAAAGAAVAGLTSWSGFTGLVSSAAAAAASATAGSPGAAEKAAGLRLVATRFARLYVSIVQLVCGSGSGGGGGVGDEREREKEQEQNAHMLFGSTGRLRDEVEHLVKQGAKVIAKEEAKKGGANANANAGAREKQLVAQCADLVCRALANNGGRASVSHPRMQTELSHWNEMRNAANAT